MNVSQAIIERRSTRAFLDKEIDPELLQEIFLKAQQSPSNCNTQPWHVTVVSGDTRKEIETRMVSEIMSGKTPSPAFKPGDKDLKDEFRKRQIACAISLYDAMGIKYEEKQKRQELMLKNWQFFGAPHAAFISMPTQFGEVNAIDIGIYVQTLMLLLTEAGLASCPQGALAMYSQPVHDLTNIPEGHAILMGLSFGYPDTEHVINKFDVGRAELSDSVEFFS